MAVDGSSPRNRVLDLLHEGKAAFGLTVRLTKTGEIARIARASGHDFLRLDLQHSLLDAETVATIAQAALGCDVPTIVRVRGFDDPDVAALLDAGVTGIVFPDVETAEQARRCVEATRFPPLGLRSYGGGYPQFDYQSTPITEAVEALERTTLVVCMIESVEGMRNLHDIAAVPGIDVIHLGLSDLLMSMGTPGQIDLPAADDAIAQVIEACAETGKYPGLGGSPTIDHQVAGIRRGIRFLTTKNDINFMLIGATQWMDQVRAQTGDSDPG